MQPAVFGMTAALLWASVVLCDNAMERPTRVVSMHYPCLALMTRVQGTVRVRCAIRPDGTCSDAQVIFGHPLLLLGVIENAKKWRFPPSKNAARTAEIEYRFNISGVRVPEDQPDVEVAFDLPNTVTVTAPFDPKAPCHMPPKACLPPRITQPVQTMPSTKAGRNGADVTPLNQLFHL